MNEKIMKYLDDVFLPYQDQKTVQDLKEELSNNLQERFADLKSQGHDDDAAYRLTIDSLGDISEVIESISVKTRALFEMTEINFSKQDLQHADLTGIKVDAGKFNYSDLRGTDFSGSVLAKCSFTCSDIRKARFIGTDLSGAKLVMADLTGANFQSCNLEGTDFKFSDLSHVCFEAQTFDRTIFNHYTLNGATFINAVFRNASFKHASGAREANFDGASMDKLTYAVLKGLGANLKNVTLT